MIQIKTNQQYNFLRKCEAYGVDINSKDFRAGMLEAKRVDYFSTGLSLIKRALKLVRC